jgi:hypothetical protein
VWNRKTRWGRNSLEEKVIPNRRVLRHQLHDSVAKRISFRFTQRVCDLKKKWKDHRFFFANVG